MSGARAGSFAGIVLAAGRSHRFGPPNKLLQRLDGRALIERVVDALDGAALAPLVVVTGHDATAIASALAGRSVRLVHNEAHERGLSGSLRRGLEALPSACPGALIALGDMPVVRRCVIEALIDAARPDRERAICVPVRAGRRGHPVLWGASYFEEMRSLTGDVGARSLLERHAHSVRPVPVEDDGVLLDVDTPEELERLRARAVRGPDEDGR